LQQQQCTLFVPKAEVLEPVQGMYASKPTTVGDRMEGGRVSAISLKGSVDETVKLKVLVCTVCYYCVK